MDKLTLFYAVTPDLPYPRYAAQSMYSAARAMPDVRIRLTEVTRDECNDYPESAHVLGLPTAGEPQLSEWAAVVDADVWFNGSLLPLLDTDADIRVRIANAWRKGQINHMQWHDICRFFGQAPVSAVYSNGLILCRWEQAVRLRRGLRSWLNEVFPDPQYAHLIDPMRIKGRPEWWMRDQYALALTIGANDWSVELLTEKHFSWNYNGESGGLCHHVGKKFDPFKDPEWSETYKHPA